VTITGPSYQSTGQVGFYLAESAQEYYGALPGPSVITCKVQTVILGMDAEAFPDTAWQTVSTQTMVASITTSGEATWKLTPTLPGEIGSQQMRLVFVEKEKVNALSTSTSGRVTFVATHVLRPHFS
jgi:hypothetical protein